MLYSVPPEPQTLALDQIHTQALAHFILTPPEPPPPTTMTKTPSNGGRGSAPAAGASGSVGRSTAPLRHGKLAVRSVTRDEARRIAGSSAQNTGILGLLEGSQIGQVFSHEPALGGDKETILGDLRGSELSDGYGHGLDPLGVGSGPGGGGRDGSTIGIGPLHGIGDCATCTNGRGRYADGPASARMSHVAKAPEVVPGKAEVRCGFNGACLDNEIIRRVVRQHHAEVRFCYEKRLMSHDALGGRVVTQFTIAATGRVLSSIVSDDSMHDGDIEQCITSAVRRWEFPRSGQTSIVTYPFILQSAR
jgi:hypothetical protein